jgi:hypothetical protein
VNQDSILVRFPQPELVDDLLTAVLRAGARRLLAQAIEAEAEAFLAAMTDQRFADGRARCCVAPRSPSSYRSPSG